MPRTDGTEPNRWTPHTVTEEEAGQTVQEVLTGSMQISRRMIQRLTRARGIRLNRRPAFLGRTVRAGDVVAVKLPRDEPSGLRPVRMQLRVVHEDSEVLVVDKPPFLLVHPTSAQQTETLAHGVAHHFREQGVQLKVRPVHRIDRDVSGLVVFAKSARAHHQLDVQLREHTLQREYLAVVHGAVEGDGVVEAPIGAHPRHPHLRAVDPVGGEAAVTRFAVLERLPRATLLRVELETGRTHQIRVHLAHLRHPLIGDRQYGAPSAPALNRPALHAARLAFTHPASGEWLELTAPLPADLEELRERLRNAGAQRSRSP